MESQSKVVHWLVWGVLAGVIAAISSVFVVSLAKHQARPLPEFGDVSDFQLTNQFGQSISRNDLGGRVWVANIIFTRCAGPCLEMSRKMKAIQDALPVGQPITLVSLTADPAFDTPAVLRAYADRFGGATTNWYFLTGEKKAVYDLAINGLKLAVQENGETPAEGDQFIHSTRMVLVDGRSRLRGISFEGTEGESVRSILAAAGQLLKEK